MKDKPLIPYDDELDNSSLEDTHLLFTEAQVEVTLDQIMASLPGIELEPLETTFQDEESTLDSTLNQEDEEVVEHGNSPTNKANRYTLLGSVGKGAMGEILLARDQDLQRKVAYKTIHPHISSNKRILQRFLTEAQITAQLDHPNIVPIYGLEVSERGRVAYSMKLIEGNTLRELLNLARKSYRDGLHPKDEYSRPALLDHFLKVCDALHYAHTKGVIHRDLKPANIMVGPYNEVYVMDWGIAHIATADKEDLLDPQLAELMEMDEDTPELERTRIGALLGTPMYMSPEQAAGMHDYMDSRSDLYTLGIILYEIVTLRRPYQTKDPKELHQKVLKAQIGNLQHYVPRFKVPVELEAIIRKATSLEPNDRYENVEEFSLDLRRFIRGESILARPDTSLQKLWRWMSNHRATTLIVLMSVLLISASVSTWSLYHRQQALIQSQTHKQKLGNFLSQMSQQSQEIDKHFLEFEMLLESLVSSSQLLLQYGDSKEQPVYTFKGLHPPDLKYSTIYKYPISTEWWVSKLAPDIELEKVEPVLRKLEPLRHTFKRLYLESSQEEQYHDFSNEEAQQLIANKGVPLAWTYVGLEQGMHVSYPGKIRYSEGYDPRKRPWYQKALKFRGKLWQKPYVDASGRGLLITCTQPLYDDHNRLLGVAGIELTFDYVTKNLMNLDIHGIKESYMLDEEGKIILRSSQSNTTDEEKQKKEFSLYPQPEVIKEVKAKHSGYMEVDSPEGLLLLAYYRIPSLGWYYVVEGLESEVLNE